MNKKKFHFEFKCLSIRVKKGAFTTIFVSENSRNTSSNPSELVVDHSYCFANDFLIRKVAYNSIVFCIKRNKNFLFMVFRMLSQLRLSDLTSNLGLYRSFSGHLQVKFNFVLCSLMNKLPNQNKVCVQGLTLRKVIFGTKEVILRSF